MRPMQKIILFLYWFGSGVVQPVLSLAFLAKGCDLRTLPLAMGIYSATVIVCEVPTGVFADLFGRKRTFLTACALYVADMALLILADSFLLVVPAAILMGLARAFSSGSLDAFFVEDAVARRGPEILPTVTGQISLCQSVGMTLGALLGGVLPMWGAYDLHLGLRGLFIAIPGVVCAVTVKERRDAGEREERVRLSTHLRDCGGLLRLRPMLWGILACFLSAGVLVALVETYWQPAFLRVAGEELRPMLGVVSALSFGAVSAGNLLTRRLRLAPGRGEWKGYFALRGLMVLAVLLFAAQLGVPGFVLGYGLIYLVMGGTDVLEMTLLNRMVPDRQRASFLSVGSLSAQMGGLLSSLMSAAAVGALGFGGLFFAGGVIVALGTLVPIVLMVRQKETV